MEKIEVQEDYIDGYTFNGDLEIDIEFLAVDSNEYDIEFFNYDDSFLNESDDFQEQFDGSFTASENTLTLEGKGLNDFTESSAEVTMTINF